MLFRWHPWTCLPPPRLFKDPTTRPALGPWSGFIYLPTPAVFPALPPTSSPTLAHPSPSNSHSLLLPGSTPHPSHYQSGTFLWDIQLGVSFVRLYGLEECRWNPKIFKGVVSTLCWHWGSRWRLYLAFILEWLLTHSWIQERQSGLCLLPMYKACCSDFSAAPNLLALGDQVVFCGSLLSTKK